MMNISCKTPTLCKIPKITEQEKGKRESEEEKEDKGNNKNDRDHGATLRLGGSISDSILVGGGGGHKTLFLTNSL